MASSVLQNITERDEPGTEHYFDILEQNQTPEPLDSSTVNSETYTTILSGMDIEEQKLPETTNVANTGPQ